jgi:hypothetical protein
MLMAEKNGYLARAVQAMSNVVEPEHLAIGCIQEWDMNAVEVERTVGDAT